MENKAMTTLEPRTSFRTGVTILRTLVADSMGKAHWTLPEAVRMAMGMWDGDTLQSVAGPDAGLAEGKIAAGIVTKVKDEHLADEARRRIIMAMFVDDMETEEGNSAPAAR